MTGLQALVFSGKAEALLASIADSSVDAVITDPPYGLEFMGKEWDSFGRDTGNGYREKPRIIPAPPGTRRSGPNYYEAGRPYQDWCRTWAAGCYRILKPGSYLAAFGGTRTYHRMVCAIEDSGFEIRDSLHWIYGSGFPKSLDAERAIAVRTCVLPGRHYAGILPAGSKRLTDDHVCQATPESAPWDGYGTALKPAHEPILLCRKPFPGTVAANVLEYGAGALNLAACTVGTETRVNNGGGTSSLQRVSRVGQGYRKHVTEGRNEASEVSGRWPPDLLLTHSADCSGGCAPGCPVAGLDAQSGMPEPGSNNFINRSSAGQPGNTGAAYGAESRPAGQQVISYGDTGGASRFFPQFTWDPEYDLPFLYQAKAPKSERPRAEGMPGHPTVKPLALMRWLARLLCPPDGLIFDPFCGTGTTVQAALLEGFRCVAADSWPDAIAYARVRLAGLDGVTFG